MTQVAITIRSIATARLCCALVHGPNAGYVSHEHTSIMSIIKTIYRSFGLGPNNLYDATATDLADMFTDQPNFDALSLRTSRSSRVQA